MAWIKRDATVTISLSIILISENELEEPPTKILLNDLTYLTQ